VAPCAGIIRIKFTGHWRSRVKLSASPKGDLAPRTALSYAIRPRRASAGRS